MRRTGPCGVLQSFSRSALLALLLLLLCLSCFPSAHIPASRWLGPANPDAPTNRLSPRQQSSFEVPNEHIVLADCTQGDRHLSSQMAYYNTSLGPTPVDVALVPTQEGKYALWINSNTNATFTDSGVWFAASIGRLVDEGNFAGYGQNGDMERAWHNFTCWRRYKYQLYTWGGVVCSMVYDCDHIAPPDGTPGTIAISSTPPTVSTQADIQGGTAPTTAPGSDSSPASTPPASTGGLSHGALIGTIVGAVAALVVGGLVGIWLLLRRRSQKKTTPADLDHPEERHEADDGKGPGFGDREKDARHELDSRLHVVEMGTEPDRYEMDTHAIAELDATEIGMDIKHLDDINQHDITEDDIKKHDIKAGGEYMMDEPKTRVRNELKARAIDKAEIRAAEKPARPGYYKEKDEQGESKAELPLRRPPVRTQTQATWTTESDVDLSGFPIVLSDPISPLSPSEAEPKPPDW